MDVRNALLAGHGNISHLNFPSSRLYIPRLPLLLVVGAAQVGEEVVSEDLGELHQRVRVNPLAGEDEIDVVAVDPQNRNFFG